MTPTTTTPPPAASDYKPGDPRSDLMNPETRDRILTVMAALSREFPSMRFGQLVCAVVSIADAAIVDSIYDIEDDELLAGAERWLERRQADR